MPKGPQGQKRPADVIGNAVHIMRIATGQTEDKPSAAPKRAAGGRIGGKKRAAKLTSEERREIAKKGAAKRWKKTP